MQPFIILLLFKDILKIGYVTEDQDRSFYKCINILINIIRGWRQLLLLS
jgi:hypothetical protein